MLNVGVACGVADFGQFATASQGVADERVAAVVDREPLPTPHLACRAEPLAEGVASPECPGERRPQRNDAGWSRPRFLET